MSKKPQKTDIPLWAKRLSRARARKFPTALAFAEFMGLSQQRYGYYEIGRSEPDYELLIQICVALEVSPNYILMGSEAMAA